MKIVFLDFDGVLNCRTTTNRYQGILGIELVKVMLVDRIVEQTGARIVISSTWRLLHSLRELRALLETHGLRNASDVVIDTTPRVLRGPEGTIQTSRPRGEEIRAWLNYTENIGSIDAFVILDDERVDMEALIQTTNERGLQQEHAIEAIRRLRSSATGNGADGDLGTNASRNGSDGIERGPHHP